MNTLRRLCLIAAIAVTAIVGHGGAMASSDQASRAVVDGIGYRAHVLDPHNAYAVSAVRMLGVLLHRFDMLPSAKPLPYPSDSTGARETCGCDYVGEVKRRIRDPKLQRTIVDPYGADLFRVGVCATNNPPTALRFMEEVSLTAMSAPTKDGLIMARHHLLGLCGEKAEDRIEILARVNRALQAPEKDGDARPWVFYLKGVAALYTDRLDAASEFFTKASPSPSKWLTDTARYMDVRIAKAQLDNIRYVVKDIPTGNSIDAEGKSAETAQALAIARFKKALHSHVTRYPKSLYAETVAPLEKYISHVSGDEKALASALYSQFKVVFAADSVTTEFARLDLFNEMAVYYFDKNGYLQFHYDHPLLIAVELSMRTKMQAEKLPVRPLPTIRQAIANARRDFSGYPGLLEFVNLLMAAAAGKDETVIGTVVDERRFGPLWPDAENLRARVLSRMGRHRQAADAWLGLSRRFAMHNAWTEIATSYVRLNRFEEFARLAPKTKNARNDNSRVRVPAKWSYDDEMDATADEFLDAFDPYMNLLLRGFDNFADKEAAQRVYADIAINGSVRFAAAEPVMRRHLLREEYGEFLAVAAKVFDGKAQFDHPRIAELASGYRKIIRVAEGLATDQSDPGSLVDMGFFLYSNRIFYRCHAPGVTLWEQTLGACKDENARHPDTVIPIEMFNRALDRFAQSPQRSPEEARALRIMIYCFKGGENRHNCARDRLANYPESTRRSWFRRLNRDFPTKERVKFWY